MAKSKKRVARITGFMEEEVQAEVLLIVQKLHRKNTWKISIRTIKYRSLEGYIRRKLSIICLNKTSIVR